MTTSLAGPRFSPELRAAIYHFSVFGTAGVASVYFGIWLTNRGIKADEIGIINAAPLFAMLVVNQLVGRIADRARDWRGVIMALSLISAAASIGLFFVSGFWGILAIWVLAVMPAFSLVPIVDAATLRMTQRRGTEFSTVRAWGTVGFTLFTIASGPLIAWFGDAAFVPIFVAFALIRALLSLQLPQFRAGDRDARPVATKGARRLREVLKPWFVVALLGVAILYSTHGVIGAFAALLWKEQGISESLIGPLLASSAAAEAVMMFVWSRLKLKVPARYIVLFACFVAAIRWTAMAFSPPVWLLFLLQLLHSVTFAMGYFGGIYFIANWTSEDIAAEAQGFCYVLQQAMSVFTILVMGWCVAAFGARAWLFVGAFSLVGAACIYLSLRLQPRSTHPVDPSLIVAEPPTP